MGSTLVRTRVRSRSGSLLGLVAAVALVAGCGSESTTTTGATGTTDTPSTTGGSAAPVEVKVGVAGSLTSIPVYLAQSKGFFAEEGLEPELTVAQSGAATIPQLLNGQLQFSIADTVATIGAVSNGVPLQIISTDVVGAATGAEDFVGVVSKDITGIEGMAGKTLAVNQLRGLAELLSRATLDAKGVDSGSVEFVEVPPPDMPAAVQQGRVDAAYALEPFLTASQRSGLKDVFSIADVAAGLPIVSFSSSRKYVEDNPDVVARFNRAVAKGTAYAAANPDEARTAAAYTELPPELLKTIKLPTFAEDATDVARVGEVADLMVQYGFLKSAPPVDQYVGAT